jgi:hypothetical protein
MKQTAVEWLVRKLEAEPFIGIPSQLVRQAKEMEKQQQEDCWDIAHQAGRYEGKGIAEENWQTFETYWQENFKPE